MTFALLTLASCQSVNLSNCSGFERNDLSPSGTVALLKADRAGAERVIGNDRNFDRICKK
jgi:hypothetical protein